MQLQNILDDLIVVPSITGDDVSCRKIIQVAQAILRADHLPNRVVKIAKRSILIWGELDLDKSEWLINSHLDVVPGNPNQFIPQTNKDKVRGRGAADTKGSCAILLANAPNWHDLAISKHITFMLVIDEEIGGDSTKGILKQMKALRGAIFLEPTGLHLTTQAKGMMQVKIMASGKSVHGSRPWEGKNAIEELVSSLIQFRISHPSPTQETRHTTFNFSQITGGKAINQVPSSAELWCDIRFNPKDNSDDIVIQIHRCFPTCEILVVKCESPINCEKSSVVFQSLASSLKACAINPLSQFDHGTSDARHATAMAIPALVFGPKGVGLHSDNEWVSLKSLTKVSNVLDHWIKNI